MCVCRKFVYGPLSCVCQWCGVLRYVCVCVSVYACACLHIVFVCEIEASTALPPPPARLYRLPVCTWCLSTDYRPVGRAHSQPERCTGHGGWRAGLYDRVRGRLLRMRTSV